MQSTYKFEMDIFSTFAQTSSVENEDGNSIELHRGNEIEVDIYSTTTEYRSVPYEIEVTRHAIIKYSVINTGTKSVEGWEVFFNVRFDSSPQLLAFESVYYRLDPREKSSYRVVEALIPEYYENARSAKLRHIATW